MMTRPEDIVVGLSILRITPALSNLASSQCGDLEQRDGDPAGITVLEGQHIKFLPDNALILESALSLEELRVQNCFRSIELVKKVHNF